jgi:Tfp pilus assembly protein PilO
MSSKLGRADWLLTLALAAGTGGYFLFFFLPGRQELANLRDQIGEKQDQIAAAAGLHAGLKTAQEQLQRARAYTAAWREKAPSITRISTFYGRIHTLANSAGVVIHRFEPQATQAFDRIRRLTVNVGCMGTFRQIHEFINEVEGAPDETWVDVIQFKKSGDSGDLVFAELVLVVFFDNSDNSD